MNKRLWFPQAPERHWGGKRIVTADFETQGLGGDFILGDFHDPERRTHTTVQQPKDFLTLFLTHEYRGFTCYFHNLEYDARYFLEELRSLIPAGFTVKPIRRSTGTTIALIIRDRCHRNRWLLVDSYALLPSKLADLAPLAGMPKLDIALAAGHTFDPLTDLPYLYRDTELLAAAVRRFAEIVYDQFGVNLRLTAGGVAIAAMARHLKRPYYRQRPEVETFCREAFFGGIASIRRIGEFSGDFCQLDARGMYAYAMRQALPVGSAAYTKREIPDRPGFYRCRVVAPESIPITFVPKRLDGGGVAWPHGSFQTVLPSHTIVAAREAGYRITVIEGYAFDAQESVFDRFVQTCETIEEANKGTALAAAIKILRNSGYGRLAMREEFMEYFMGVEPPDGDYTPVIDQYTGEMLEYEFEKPVVQPKPFMHIEWAAWITATARLRLVELEYAAGEAAVLRDDTDGVLIEVSSLMKPEVQSLIGSHYGDYKVEGRFDGAIVDAAKVCAVHVVGKPPDEWVIKCKGIHNDLLSVDDIRAAARGERVDIPIILLPRLQQMTERGQPRRVLSTRAISVLDQSRAWQRGEGNRVEPVTLAE